MSEKSFGVYGKIAKTMLEMGAVGKDAKHFQGYQYQSAEAVVTALRGVMANIGLVMLSECIQSTDTGSEWLCEYRFTFVDIEDGSSHSLLWQQSTPYMMKDKLDDKAMGKNHTYAQKYFLLRTFLISSKDDPDADTNISDDFQTSGKKGNKKQSKSTIPFDGASTSGDDDKVWNMVKAVFGNDRPKFESALSQVDNNLSDADKAKELVKIAKAS